MAKYWLIVTLSWIGSANLQYISNAEPGSIVDTLGSLLGCKWPNLYYNEALLPTTSEKPTDYYSQYPYNILPPLSQRIRRNPSDNEEMGMSKVEREEAAFARIMDANNTKSNQSQNNDVIVYQLKKRSFSPWGGKRDVLNTGVKDTWSWKRASFIREPSMPKRVRFSPWGGKRSSQMIYKPGAKAPKIIFSSTVPEIRAKYGLYDLAGYIGSDKQHPLKALALSSRYEKKSLRDALPYRAYIESAKMFKPGNPYSEVHLKTDGKRKVKFSAWGGKRSPPIIGPIWSTSSSNAKDNALRAILLI